MLGGRFQETLVGPDHRSADDKIAGNGSSRRGRSGKAVSGRAGTEPRRRRRRNIFRPPRRDGRERKRLRPSSGSARRTRRRFPDAFPDSRRLPAFGRVALENDDPSGELLLLGEPRWRRRRPQVDISVDSRRELRAFELGGRRHAPDPHLPRFFRKKFRELVSDLNLAPKTHIFFFVVVVARLKDSGVKSFLAVSVKNGFNFRYRDAQNKFLICLF